MRYAACFLLLAFAAAAQQDAEIVFRSDVSLVRVDAQVVDRNNRAITGLSQEDFRLFDEGKEQEIRNFSPEDMPVDVLLLLDVSGSMRPHVERVASAAHRALRVLGPQDRVAVMVFDRSTRVRMPFRSAHGGAEQGIENVLAVESFDGGTDITRGLLDAARYVASNARRDARHAIVILTDDQTERDRNEAAVLRALTQADAVLSGLLAPDAMGTGGISVGTPWPRRGGGGGLGGPLGGIILGRRGPLGGGWPGPAGGGMGSHTQSAGTAEIARRSGGDSLPVDDATALETTFERIRQRYALHFHVPAGARPGQERSIDVELTAAAMRRYPGAEVRFRRVYLTPGSLSESDPEVTTVSRTEPPDEQVPPLRRRRPAVNEDGTRADSPPQTTPSKGGWRRTDDSTSAPAPAAAPAPEQKQQPAQQETEAPKKGGWRRVKPGEQP